MDDRIKAAVDRALELGEVGFQVAAYQGENLIVDVAVGIADPGRGTPVTPDTLFAVFSVTKAITATAVHVQAARGRLDLDAPIATYWPEYGVNGKESTRIRDVLIHRTGAPQMPEDLTLERLADWDWIVRRLAEMKPLLPPGTRTVYHSMSFGYILGEVIRRTDPQHRLPGDFIRNEICEPLGIHDLWIGIPAELEGRVAKLLAGEPWPPTFETVPNPLRRAVVPPALTLLPDVWNQSEVRRACIPAAGGIMSARAGGKYFSLLANGGELNGVRLLPRENLIALTEPRPDPLQIDEGRGLPVPLGIGGYHVGAPHPNNDPVVGRGAHLLSHSGAGGSIGWADLDAKLAVMITHNRMFSQPDTPRDKHPFIAIANAVRAVASEAT